MSQLLAIICDIMSHSRITLIVYTASRVKVCSIGMDI